MNRNPIPNMQEEQVILVDERNQPRGLMGKMEAHRKGELHRAFSVFIFNSQGEMLLQRRALHKYHSGGLWTNTCCSHPREGESIEVAARRRLREEMGIECELRYGFSFIYHQQVGELIEHELDHVLVGTFDGVPAINPQEVSAWKTMGMEALLADIDREPAVYTVWFRLCLPLLESWRQAGFSEKFPGWESIPYIA